MLRPSNINAGANTADFRCDVHDAYKIGLNLNTVATYEDNSKLIRVDYTMLDAGADLSSCKHVSFFPVANGNQGAQDLAAAKTS